MIRNWIVVGVVALFAQGTFAANSALETPRNRTAISGKALFSGWHCDAEKIEIEFSNGSRVEAAYGAPRADAAGQCDGKENIGFGVLYNMSLLGTGEHTVKALADGEVFKTSTFTVLQMSSGEFLSGASATTTVADFPSAGHTVTLTWEQTLQNFVITAESTPQDAQAGTGLVFDNGVLDPQYAGGMGGFDEAAGWASCMNDGGADCPSFSWELVDDDERGSVLEITYADEANVTAGFFFNTDTDESIDAGTATGLDMSAFEAGMVNFDVKVISEGNNTDGWVYKQDCFYPCTSGDKTIGKAGVSGWETVSIPVADLLPGLDLTKVSTGIVLWPAKDASGFKYRLDNVYWSQ